MRWPCDARSCAYWPLPEPANTCAWCPCSNAELVTELYGVMRALHASRRELSSTFVLSPGALAAQDPASGASQFALWFHRRLHEGRLQRSGAAARRRAGRGVCGMGGQRRELGRLLGRGGAIADQSARASIPAAAHAQVLATEWVSDNSG